jgi:hypothetical protein
VTPEPAEQVVGRAGQVRRAVDAGLPRELAVVLVAASASWRRGDGVPALAGLADAVWHPRASLVDAVFVAAMRRIVTRPVHR